MVVQHNMQALNANRMLGITAGKMSGSTEKLSSGYKVNRAADDAAGLAISEKMRKQIRGLTQASSNAEDGVSCVQTAEGALAEIQDMLQRMNELCVQAANGTNSKTDRQYIQDEIDQLVTEVNRISETTKFNETYLLKGDETKAKSNVYITNYSATYTENIVSNADENKYALGFKVNYTGTNNVVMVDSSILDTGSTNFHAGTVIHKGDDVTDYMTTCTFEAAFAEPKNIVLGTDLPVPTDWATDATPPVAFDPATHLEIDASGAIAIKTGVNIKDTNGTGTVVALTDITKYYKTDATPTRNDVILKSGKTTPDWYDDKGNKVDPKSLLTYGADGKAYPKDGVDLTKYYKDDKQTTALVADEQDKYYESALKITDALTGQPVADTDLKNYFNEQGEYTGGLSWAGQRLTDDEVKSCITITPNDPKNAANANFNTDDWVAFVNVELNSNVADGANGKVDSQLTGGDTGCDLSRNGVNDEVRANRDLYVYNTTNDTVVHLRAGDLMTDYLNDDNTMKSDYRLVDYISSKKGTGDHVQAQMLGYEMDADGKPVLDGNGDPIPVTKFEWTDNYIERALSLQKLYNFDGQEISGVALNDYFDNNGNYKGGLYTTDQARAVDLVFGSTTSDEYIDLEDSGYKPRLIEEFITQKAQKLTGPLDINLHAGSDSDRENKIYLAIDTMSATGLGIDKIASWNIGIVDTTGENATDAIDVVGKALQIVSKQRSILGAVQNRLEHTIKNLDNVVENTTEAESNIRDTDMAEEMVQYSNNNILIQAGQSMLAQANQSNQGVLSLLQ